jgi:hypothetical protein
MSTRGKKPGPRDLVLKSLKASRLDPGETRGFLRKLAGCRYLTYCGYLRKEPQERFFLLSYKEKSPGGTGTAGEAVTNRGADELVPFFLSRTEAKQQIKDLRIGVPNMVFPATSSGKFFKMVLESGKTPCLCPGAGYSRTFSAEEVRELIRLSEKPKIPPHTKTRPWKEYLRLKEAYARESAEKAASRGPSPGPSPGRPPTLAELLELAEYSLGERLSFQPQFKKAFLALPDSKNFLELFWNITWSLANIYHIFHFSPHDFPPERFLEETGLEVRDTEKGSMIFDPRKKEDLRICFHALKRNKQIMVSDLDFGMTAHDH